MVTAIVTSSATPATITMPRGHQVVLAKLRPGTPKTVSSAEKSEAKMRRDGPGQQQQPGQWKRGARSTKVRSASSAGWSRWTTTPRISEQRALGRPRRRSPRTATPSEIRKISSGSSDSSV